MFQTVVSQLHHARFGSDEKKVEIVQDLKVGLEILCREVKRLMPTDALEPSIDALHEIGKLKDYKVFKAKGAEYNAERVMETMLCGQVQEVGRGLSM